MDGTIRVFAVQFLSLKLFPCVPHTYKWSRWSIWLGVCLPQSLVHPPLLGSGVLCGYASQAIIRPVEDLCCGHTTLLSVTDYQHPADGHVAVCKNSSVSPGFAIRSGQKVSLRSPNIDPPSAHILERLLKSLLLILLAPSLLIAIRQ